MGTRINGRIGLRVPSQRPRSVSVAQNRPTESALVNRVLAYLKRQPNCWVRKTHGSGYTSGLADLIGCVNGRFFAIELKRERECPTPLQEMELRSIRQAGGVAFWADTFQGVVDGLESATNK